MKPLRNFSYSIRSLPLALLVVGILAYGIHIAWMGFYWDDWPWVWFSHVMGSSGMLQIDIEHRPISGVVLWLGSILAGENPLGWQIYNFTWRVLGALAFAWALRNIWPRQGQQIAWVALLFLVYPGFGQQFVAVNNSRHIFPLITFFLSIGLMARANRKRERYWLLTITALILAILTMFTTEYYYGLELIRPLVLWLVIRGPRENRKARLFKIFKAWLPYLVLLILVFAWRYLISKSVNYGITFLDDLRSSPGEKFPAYLLGGLQDIFDSAVTAWGQIFLPPDPTLFGTRTQVYFFGIAALTVAFVLVYLFFLRSSPRKAHWGIGALLLGSGALLVAPIPFWVTGLDPRLAFPGDRLNLPMMVGACLVLVGLLDLFFRSKNIKITIVAILVGLSVGFHYKNAVSYRRDWLHQSDIFQQISWRVPGLKSGTILLSNELPSQYSSDNSLVAPLNWTYFPKFSGGDLPIFMYYTELRFRSDYRKIEPGAKYTELYRFYPFYGSSDQILLIYQQLPGCLRVLDWQHHQADPSLPDEIRDLLNFSNLNQILTDQVVELPPPFQSAAYSKSWCYYFEKADLARQRAEWSLVVQYADLAFETGFPDSPAKHLPEYTVFIEGYAHTGSWKRAAELTLEAYRIDPQMQKMLCSTWERIHASTLGSPEKTAAFDKIDQQLDCNR